MSTLEMILVGGVGAAITTMLLKIVESLVMFFMNRKAKKHDAEEIAQSKFEKDTNEAIRNLQIATKTMLQDRIRYLCQVYIKAGKISFDDRASLMAMHDAYHNCLHGNGNLDQIMSEMLELPTEVKE